MAIESLISAVSVAAPVLLTSALTTPVFAEEISIQSRLPPLQFTDASPGGAHPVAGPTKAFVDHANTILAPVGISLIMHPSGNVHSSDAALGVEPPLVSRRDFGTLAYNVMMA